MTRLVLVVVKKNRGNSHHKMQAGILNPDASSRQGYYTRRVVGQTMKEVVEKLNLHAPRLIQQALDALVTARAAIEPLTGAQIRLHRIPVDTAVRIENAITVLRCALGVVGTPESKGNGDG